MISCSPTFKVGKSGVEGGRGDCDPPFKKQYARNIKAEAKASAKRLKGIDSAQLNLALNSEVVKLSSYSTKGMDYSLFLFYLCKTAIFKNFSAKQTEDLFNNIILSWGGNLAVEDSYSIKLPENITLETASKFVANDKGKSIRFENCSKEILDLKIDSRNEFKAKEAIGVIFQLRYRLMENPENLQYEITENEKGIYVFSCN